MKQITVNVCKHMVYLPTHNGCRQVLAKFDKLDIETFEVLQREVFMINRLNFTTRKDYSKKVKAVVESVVG